MDEYRFTFVPFWAGLAFALAFAGVGTWSLMNVLNTHALADVAGTAWKLDGVLFRTWAFAVPFGSLLAVIGALVYIKAGRVLVWAVAMGVPVIVVPTIMVFSTRYYPGGFYGVGGLFILVCFFFLVRVWMKEYAGQGRRVKIAGVFKLTGYLFWINASWFLCGDTAKLHLQAFEGTSVPSPTETMVFLVLGWFFVTLGEHRSVKAARGS